MLPSNLIFSETKYAQHSRFSNSKYPFYLIASWLVTAPSFWESPKITPAQLGVDGLRGVTYHTCLERVKEMVSE